MHIFSHRQGFALSFALACPHGLTQTKIKLGHGFSQIYTDKDYVVFKSAIADIPCPTCEGVAKSEALSVAIRVNLWL